MATTQQIHSPIPSHVHPQMFHLRWSNGVTLCGVQPPVRCQVWPWTEGMLTRPEACPSCVTAYKQPKTAIAAAA
jgi:hypothetical protein